MQNKPTIEIKFPSKSMVYNFPDVEGYKTILDFEVHITIAKNQMLELSGIHLRSHTKTSHKIIVFRTGRLETIRPSQALYDEILKLALKAYKEQ